MINIMIEISSYIFVAILLGYFFGWLITKLLLKKRYEVSLDEMVRNKNIELESVNKIKDEIYKYKKENRQLKVQNKELHSGYNGQKYVLNEHNQTLDEFQKQLQSKNEVIANLTSRLSLLEEEKERLEKKYEEEIDAFMFERIDITQKYKELLAKFNLLKKHKGMLKVKNSWFSKFFSSSSSTASRH